jgi:hypothetical protein|tara:strand:+ start:66 stop:521 length:456 start_codon:yes stop_codon:yes gene_type:complete
MICIKDDILDFQDIKKLLAFTTHPFYTHDQSRCRDLKPDYPIVEKLRKNVTKYNTEVAQIITLPEGAAKNFHFDTARITTKLTSVTFLNDDFIGGQPVVEGIEITPIIGRTYFFDGTKYSHAVLNVIKGDRHTLTMWYSDKKFSEVKDIYG